MSFTSHLVAARSHPSELKVKEHIQFLVAAHGFPRFHVGFADERTQYHYTHKYVSRASLRKIRTSTCRYKPRASLCMKGFLSNLRSKPVKTPLKVFIKYNLLTAKDSDSWRKHFPELASVTVSIKRNMLRDQDAQVDEKGRGLGI